MTILSVVRDVCAVVGVSLPTSVFSGLTANRTMQEFVALSNEMAQRIAFDTRDWTRLRSTFTMTGDDVTTAFTLPADFRRMLLTANVWRSDQTQTPMAFFPDLDEWLNRRVQERVEGQGEWTIYGGQIHVFPAMTTGQTAYFPYLHRNCIALGPGGTGDVFQNDNDAYLLDERVLKLGMIAQWKAHKGSPYAEDMGTYGDALTYAMGHDSPAPIIMGRRPVSVNARVAYPWPVPT